MNTTQNCSTCTHGDPDGLSIADYCRQHYLDAHPGWLICTKGQSDDGYEADDDTTAVAVDAEEYHAYLFVKPEHSCSMWRPKG